jgi:decaprenylphospho-beta-D-erythro-pentofuranosid-2-ulose 2-reductase
VLVLGGTSEIALAVLRELDLDDSAITLAGRDRVALERVAAELPGRVSVEQFDARDVGTLPALLDRLFGSGDVDLVLPAFGILGQQARAEREPDHAVEILTVDLVAQASVLLAAARRLREQGHGVLVVFSSVAAVRPRRANFVYGAGKAGLDALARGLRDSLHGSGVHLLLVRPGFVVGRMTAGLPPAPMAVTPEDVGRAVARAIRARRSVVWVPRQVRLLAGAMRLVPAPLWRRVSR